MMNLIINENEYEIDRINFSTYYVEPEDGAEHGRLNQNLNLSIKDNSILNEIKLDIVEGLNEIIVIQIQDKTITFEDFVFEAFDAYLDENSERFDVRFHKNL